MALSVALPFSSVQTTPSTVVCLLRVVCGPVPSLLLSFPFPFLFDCPTTSRVALLLLEFVLCRYPDSTDPADADTTSPVAEPDEPEDWYLMLGCVYLQSYADCSHWRRPLQSTPYVPRQKWRGREGKLGVSIVRGGLGSFVFVACSQPPPFPVFAAPSIARGLQAGPSGKISVARVVLTPEAKVARSAQRATLKDATKTGRV
jgi:hypothetical protein